MSERTIRQIFTFVAVALISATMTRAQSLASSEVPATPASLTWQVAQSVSRSRGRIFVVTFDYPQRLQACHIQSVTLDKLVCSQAFRRSRIYTSQQIVALILPEDDDLR